MALVPVPAAVWYVLQFGPIVGAIIWLVSRRSKSSMRRSDWFVLASAGGVALAALLSVVFSVAPVTSAAQVTILVLVFAFLVLTYWKRWGEPKLRGDMILVFVLLCSAELVGLILVAIRVPGALGPYSRFEGLLSNANYAGMLACIALPLAIYVFRSGNRTVALVGAAVALTALLLSGSRGALMAAGAGLFVLVFLLPIRRMLITLGALVVGGGVTAAFVAPILASSLFNRATYGSDITSGRVGVYEETLLRWTHSPLFGTGYRTTETFTTDGLSGHNTYLSVLTETGILGALALLLLVVIVAVAGARKSNVLLGAAVAVAVMEITESSIFGFAGPTALAAWLVVFAFAAAGRTNSQPSPEIAAIRVHGQQSDLAADAPAGD
jgi:O-antigen ligase